MNQDLIAQMIAHEEAARLLVYRAAWLADQKRPNNLEASIGKYTAAEAANFAADAAMKILGAYGYSTEFPVERTTATPSPIRSSKAPRTCKR
jgi:glutaryl-CoA dehydrogenase (non-decarboxylating)